MLECSAELSGTEALGGNSQWVNPITEAMYSIARINID